MPTFSYAAIDAVGSPITGTLEADSETAAKTILSAKGYIPSSVSETGKKRRGLSSIGTVGARDLIIFSKQFGTMLKAGVAIVRIFEVLEAQTENPKLRNIITEMIQDVEQGRTLYEAFSNQPKAFSPLYCSMVHAGENAGSLPVVMDRLIYITEHEEKVKSEIKAALTYPIIVVIALTGAFFILLTFVIPQFIYVFEKSKIDLPLPTVIANMLYHFLIEQWYIALGILVLVSVPLWLYLKTPAGRMTRDTLFLKLPLFGPLFQKAAMSRFASIFSILQSSGVGILDGLVILSSVIGNKAIAKEFDRLAEELKEGRGISAPLRTAKYFTPMVINMIAIGEESGNLEEMLSQISNHYDTEVMYATKRLSDMVGPILTVALAVVVLFFALAIFLPMWDMTKMVK